MAPVKHWRTDLGAIPFDLIPHLESARGNFKQTDTILIVSAGHHDPVTDLSRPHPRMPDESEPISHDAAHVLQNLPEIFLGDTSSPGVVRGL